MRTFGNLTVNCDTNPSPLSKGEGRMRANDTNNTNKESMVRAGGIEPPTYSVSRTKWTVLGSDQRPSRCKRDALLHPPNFRVWVMQGLNLRPSRCKRDALPLS